MPDFLKVFIYILFFNACALSVLGQATDSVQALNKSSAPPQKFTPDTVYLTNGDRISGNIISYEEGRLKIDAQSVGVVNIKHQKIYSIGGGSRLYYLKNIRDTSYTGYIRLSKDNGEILLTDSVTSKILRLRFPDIALFRPVKSLKDTSKVENATVQEALIAHIPDTIFLKNRERYTGNIISMEQGRVKIDAQGTGVVNIKWHKIFSISGGNRLFKIEDQRGEIYIGDIRASKDTGEIIVVGKNKNELRLEEVVRIFPLEQEWYRGFKGSVGGGFNYTKSSDVLNINFDYNLYYVVKKWRFKNGFSFLETSTSREEDKSVRISVDFVALYSLPNKWVLSEVNAFNRNDELGIKSRISFGAGGGYNIVLTETQRLLALSGFVQNTETSVGSSEASSNFELPITLQHTVYSFIRPDLTSTTELAYYKGLTESKRYRVDASTDITWEFIKWVNLKLTFYYNFDNKEVEGKESENDYGTVISLIIDLK